jgi:hypothetical protein
VAHPPIRRARSLRLRPWGLALGIIAPVAACAAGGPSSQYGSSATSGGDTSSNGGSATTSGGNNGGSGSNSGGFGSSGGSEGPDSGHGEKCDGDVCTCITIASIGHEGVWGPCNGDTTTAFQQWLNSESTAVVSTYDQTQPMLTPDFLNQYNVIILQWMVADGQKNQDGAPWVFSSEEVTNLQNWVNAGGGIISLTGYQGTTASQIFDIVATNQLLSFTDMQLNADDTLDGNVQPLEGEITAENGQCWGSAVPLGAAEAPAVPTSMGTWSQSTPIGKNVTEVGAFSGRSIKVNNSAKVVIDATDGTLVYSAHEQIGKGFVIVYGDEWITYTGEWTGEASCTMGFSFDSGTCDGKSAAQVFQIAQFWYNSIEYASGSIACFKINNSGVIE